MEISKSNIITLMAIFIASCHSGNYSDDIRKVSDLDTHIRLSFQYDYLNDLSFAMRDSTMDPLIASFDSTVNFLDTVHGQIEKLSNKSIYDLTSSDLSKTENQAFNYLSKNYSSDELRIRINTPINMFRDMGYLAPIRAKDNIEDPIIRMNAEKDSMEYQYWIDWFKGYNLLEALQLIRTYQVMLRIYELKYLSSKYYSEPC